MKGFIRIFQNCVITVTVLFIMTYFYISTQYNLQQLSFIPSSFRILTDRINNARSEQDKMVTGSDVSEKRMQSSGTGTNYTLLDLPVVKYNPAETREAKMHEILWYNLPRWVNFNLAFESLRSQCAYQNCRMSNKHGDIANKSAVIFCLTETLPTIPPSLKRSENQVWIVFWVEPPGNIDKPRRVAYRHRAWRNTINWTMSYRTDSDIFYPYGALTSAVDSSNKNYEKIYASKDRFAAWVVSNCYPQSRRMEYTNELIDHGIQVDIYGRCGRDKNFLRFEDIKEIISKKYKFYLSFENSFCEDYVTEKFFRYYNLDVILVVRGGANYSKLLPPKTYIDTSAFNSSYSLANYLLYVGNNKDVFIDYLMEKDRYVAKELFQMTDNYCRICEKLNHLHENRRMIGDIVPMLYTNQCSQPADLNHYHYLTGFLTMSNMGLAVLTVLVFWSCLQIICRFHVHTKRLQIK